MGNRLSGSGFLLLFTSGTRRQRLQPGWSQTRPRMKGKRRCPPADHPSAAAACRAASPAPHRRGQQVRAGQQAGESRAQQVKAPGALPAALAAAAAAPPQPRAGGAGTGRRRGAAGGRRGRRSLPASRPPAPLHRARTAAGRAPAARGGPLAHTHTPPPKIAPAAPIGCGDLDVRRRLKFRRGGRGECGAALEPGGPTGGWVTPTPRFFPPPPPQQAPCLGPEPAAPSRPSAPPRRGPELGCGGLGASSAFCSPRPHSPSSLWRPRADAHRPAPCCPHAGGPLHLSTPSSLHQRLKASEVWGRRAG